MSAYPVLYEAEYVEKRSRLTTFFRGILVIPHIIVLYLIAIGLFFTVIGAWFAVVITGRYPQGLYDFNSNALRWLSRVGAYGYLLVDKYPPFDFGDHPEYPVQLTFAGPLPKYSRLKAFFRTLIGIPVMIIAYALSIVYQICALAAWVVGVILGRQPRGLFDGLQLGLAYQSKASAYLLLLTETYPPFSNENPTLEPVGASGELESAPSAFAAPTTRTPAERPGGLEG